MNFGNASNPTRLRILHNVKHEIFNFGSLCSRRFPTTYIPSRLPSSPHYTQSSNHAMQATLLISTKGSFNNCVDKSLPFFDPPPPCQDGFYTLSVDKNRHFLTPSPPHLVHVVIEWPLDKSLTSRQVDKSIIKSFVFM